MIAVTLHTAEGIALLQSHGEALDHVKSTLYNTRPDGKAAGTCINKTTDVAESDNSITRRQGYICSDNLEAAAVSCPT